MDFGPIQTGGSTVACGAAQGMGAEVEGMSGQVTKTECRRKVPRTLQSCGAVQRAVSVTLGKWSSTKSHRPLHCEKSASKCGKKFPKKWVGSGLNEATFLKINFLVSLCKESPQSTAFLTGNVFDESVECHGCAYTYRCTYLTTI